MTAAAGGPRIECDVAGLAGVASHLLGMPVAGVMLVPREAGPADAEGAAEPVAALCRRLVATAGWEPVEDLAGLPGGPPGGGSFLAVPVSAEDAPELALCVLGRERRRWSAEDRRRLADLAAALAAGAGRPVDDGDRRWREILREAPVAVSVVRGPDHRVEYVNEFLLRLFGRRDYLGRPLREVAPELAEQGLLDAYDRVYAAGEPFVAEELPIVIRRPGEDEAAAEGFFNVMCRPLRRDDGRIDGVLGVGVDVTEQVRSRRDAERGAARLDRLQRVGTALGSALTPEAVGDVVVTEGLTALGAAAGIVAVLEDGAGLVVSAVGYPDELVARIARFRLDDPIPLATAMSEGSPLWLESEADWIGRWPAPTSGRGAVGAAVPLVSEGRVIGAVGLRFDAQVHVFPPGERDFILALTRLCSQAMERARLYAAERRARAKAERAERRSRLLAEVSLAVDAPVGVEERLKSLAALVVPAIGDFCTVRLLEPGGTARLAATAHVDPSKEPLVRRLYGRHYSPDAAVGPAHVMRTGQPGLVHEVTMAMWRGYAPDQEFLDGLAQLAPISYLCVPLTARGRVLGALSLMSAESGRHFDREDLDLVGEIGRRAGLSLDNARLYEAERSVATTLQEALLPESLPEVAGVELARRYVASTEPGRVGGDWFDAIALEEGRLVLCVGDVVGRGAQAAAVMGQLRAALNVLVREGLDPGAVLDRLSRVAETIRGAHTTTAAVCLLELETDEAVYACAGHPPPVLLTRDGAARLLWEGRSPPLGVAGGPSRTCARVALRTGEGLLLYTDGLVERRGESLDLALGRLVRAAGERAEERPGDLCDRVLARMVPGGSADDDVALLVARRAGVRPAPFEIVLPARAYELAGMRDALRAWLAAAGADADEIGDIVLACDEAAANAVEHAYLDGEVGRMTVLASVDGEGRVLLEVRDSGRWRSEPAPGDRGRGIPLMRALMDTADVLSGPAGCAVRMSRRLRRSAPAPPAVERAVGASVASEPSRARLVDIAHDRTAPVPRVSARLAGDVDHASVPDLARRLHEAVDAGQELALDLREVRFLDSAGVRMIAELAELVAPAGRLRLLVEQASPPARALRLAGVDRIAGLVVDEGAPPAPR